MYAFVPYNVISKYIPEMEKEKVSVIARSSNGFLNVYKKYGKDLPSDWLIKRHNFIKRHLAQYNLNPTYRRRLALLAWAYKV